MNAFDLLKHLLDRANGRPVRFNLNTWTNSGILLEGFPQTSPVENLAAWAGHAGYQVQVDQPAGEIQFSKPAPGQWEVRFRSNFADGMAGAMEELAVFDPYGELLYTKPDSPAARQQAADLCRKLNQPDNSKDSSHEEKASHYPPAPS